jgi:hypothetical protein
MDPAAGNFIEFTKRSLDNFNNDKLLIDICRFFKCQEIYINCIGGNRFFIMKKI